MEVHEPEPGDHGDLAAALHRLAHILPAQGPIDVFIHHNTLHAFEDRPVEDAVEEAARLFGTEPYWPEARYRAHLASGRIPDALLREALATHMGSAAHEPLVGAVTRADVALFLARHGIVDRRGPALR